MTLRARLVLILVLLAAGGLLVVGAVTYTTQRSFQLQRVDDQTQAAEPALNNRLEEEAGIDGDRDGRFGRPPRMPDGRPDPRQADLPPGTYGQLRDPAGKVLATVTLSYGQDGLAMPSIPAGLTAGQVVTVGAADGADQRFRLRVLPARSGGVLVAAVPLGAVDDALSSLLLALGLVIAAVLVLLGALAWWLVGRGLRPLQRMGETAGAIAGGDLARRVEDDDPRTEVGRLGVALNGMLGRIEQAFTEREASEGRLRQFLSDASHELRTPLASIRGYAELDRMGALQDAEARAGAMQRIEDEAARMGVLVEDLLVLARLDEVRDPVRVEVDVAALAEDAAADARATAPRRVVRAEVEEGALVVGDPDQLRQVLANLVRNALVHTPDGTPVEVRALPHGARVRLEVRDHGPGLPPGDPARLFDRFWRSEGPGRQKGRAGAGLGLAIVAGIAQAHGGEVSAQDAPGGGAVFVVELPRAAGYGRASAASGAPQVSSATEGGGTS